MKVIKTCAAQGDLLVRRATRIPDGACKLEPTGDHHVVAHSETGHHHVLPSDAELWREPGNEMVCYLRCEGAVLLEHLRPFDTHETIQIPAGIWEIRRQREYTPEGWRRVED
jgi:hypothetical protein